MKGFWQYGDITFEIFYKWVNTLLTSDVSWSLFDLVGDDYSQSNPGQYRAPDASVVTPGCYVLLQTDGSPIRATLTANKARPRTPTLFNTPAQEDPYTHRARQRDGRCLLTGLVYEGSWSRITAAHIFPRVHYAEWSEKGYTSKVTDTAAPSSVGGPSKIDTIQNIIMLRQDLHAAWDDYEFGIDPDGDYRAVAFINGLSDIQGLHLDLSHITEPTIRPLDELFRDHFLQGLLKHVKGASEPTWDAEERIGGAFDLSRRDLWGGIEDQVQLEMQLDDRLFNHRVAQNASL